MPAVDSVHFAGKQTSHKGESSPVLAPKVITQSITQLFNQPSKNVLWSLGYGLGGVMLLPIPPVATGAFCLALLHFASASYQFLSKGA